MRDLDKNVTYTTEGVIEERVKELYRWFLRNDMGWRWINYRVSEIMDCEIEYDDVSKQWVIYELRGEATSINTLFEGEAPFDKGGRDSLVLVSNDLAEWSVEEVVLEYKGLYYCDGEDGVLEPYNYIMKLTEEQKHYLNK